MTRSVDATLLAALPTAAGTFICKVQFKRAATSETITTLRSFEINEGRLTAKVTIPKVYAPTTVNPQPLNDTIFQISRGLNIQGTDYYFASSWFVLQSIERDDYNITYHGHIFKSSRYTTAADVAANTVISNVLANSYVSGLGYSNTITYPSDVEWWKTIKFYPAGRTLVLQNIESFNSILNQKYILNLIDTGGNVLMPHDNGQINQYEPITAVVTPITQCVEFSYSLRAILTKYYIWRDEANTVHTSGSSARPQHNLGYIESTVTPFTLDEYDSSKLLATLAPPDLRLTISDYIQITSPAGTVLLDWFRIKETFDPTKKIPWFQTLESMALLSNTEGGPMPSTIEAAAPYTPLNVTNFNAVLSANDNNIQAAMDTIDDHAHSSTSDLDVTETFKLSGDITPTALSATQNNYNPTGWDSATVMRLEASGANRTITGLAGGADGRIAVLINIGSTYVISLQDESGSSTAANRFALPVPSATLMNIHPGATVILEYDATTSRWRPITTPDHVHLTGIGNNTHANIDTHISSTHLAFNDGEGNPADPGSASADGTSTYAARRDHVHKGPTKAVIIFPTHALSDTVNASSTEYLCPFIDGNFGTERAMAITRAGTVKNFYVRQVGTQPASGTLVCHVRQNTASDIISITIAAGSAGPATRSETATSVAVSAGDFIGFKFVNNATAVSATIGFVIVEIEFDP